VHLTHLPALRDALRGLTGRDIMIVAGGVIPKDDEDRLRRAGVSAVFPPGTPVAQAAIAILDALNARLGYAQRAAQ
jgi:methylmalonyl-CoA mutase